MGILPNPKERKQEKRIVKRKRNRAMSHFRLSFFKRLKACWLIITNKEFYLEVITSRYDSGEELSATVISNLWNTETAVNRLKKGLNIALKIIKDDKKRKEL